jgi:hypothetical protein
MAAQGDVWATEGNDATSTPAANSKLDRTMVQ